MLPDNRKLRFSQHDKVLFHIINDATAIVNNISMILLGTYARLSDSYRIQNIKKTAHRPIIAKFRNI